MHLIQSGCSTKNRLLSFSHRALYPRLDAARTSSGCSGLCASQYFCPGGTSALQPGCLQGTYGLYGMCPAPFSILADNNISHIQSGHLRTFPADFIFYICSTLQVLWRSSFQQLSHYTSCVEAIVFSTTQPLHFICCGGRLFDNSAATLHVLRQSSFRQLRHYTSCVVAVVFPTTQPLHFMCCGGRLFDN